MHLPSSSPAAPAALRRPSAPGIHLAVLLLAGVIGVCSQPVVRAGQDFDDSFKVAEGLAISPVRLNLKNRDRRLVGIGSYIVNAQSACTQCHTAPPYQSGGDPFQGQREKDNKAHFLAGGLAFGPFVSPNITPDIDGKPAGLSRPEFLRILRTGMTEDHPQLGPLLQVMPWPAYSDLRTQELNAIYEYLRAIPHAEPAPQP